MKESNEKILQHHQKINLCPSKSNTQTYSIHSEEGPSPTSRVVPSIETLSVEGTYAGNLKASKSSSSTVRQSVRHYSKHCYQHSDTSDNEEQTTDENCPLEDILHHRLCTSK